MEIGAIALFGFVAAVTPGPNNVMLWASGLNFGLRKTVPHMAGITIGFMSLLMATAFGLGAIFTRFPSVSTAVRIAGSGYLLYLAYRVATAGRTEAASGSRPFSFWEAAAFQYANPKAWLVNITAAGTFLPADEPLVGNVVLMAATFGAVIVPAVAIWAAGGTAMGRLMRSERTLRVVNGLLGLALVYTVYLINT